VRGRSLGRAAAVARLAIGAWSVAASCSGTRPDQQALRGEDAASSDRAESLQVSAQEIDITWGMRLGPDGKTLVVEYTATNRSTERLYLCDILLAQVNNQLVRVDSGMIVTNGSRKDEVRLTRGVVEEHVWTSAPRNPGARAFDPGQSLSGSATLPLPLKAWHNFGAVRELDGTPKVAVLELSYVRGEVSWGELRLSDGSTVTVPDRPARLVNVVGPEQPMPQ